MSKQGKNGRHVIDLGAVDLEARIEDQKTYEKRLEEQQIRLLSVQQSYFVQNRRAIIVLEGRDTAGKGGSIRRMTERLDPRGVKVWPIGPPGPHEQGRHYLYRFWQRLPEPGTIAVFDRSWYGRVLVERIEGFASESAWKRAYDEINQFERLLVDDGVHIVKLFLHIDRAEQRKRLLSRYEDPYKRWKLTASDLRDHARWEIYEEALRDMFERTSTPEVPWHVIPANHKWFARVGVAQTVADRLSEGVQIHLPDLDPDVARMMPQFLAE